MPHVIFLRAANVGGHRIFRPAQFAKDLEELDVVSIGAAGTFVVRDSVSQSDLKSILQARLPFTTEIMICRSSELTRLVKNATFPHTPGVRPFVSITTTRPTPPGHLPVDVPSGKDWQVRITDIRGRFILSLWRRAGKRPVYPNAAVESVFGIPATTRNWDTLRKVDAAIREKKK